MFVLFTLLRQLILITLGNATLERGVVCVGTSQFIINKAWESILLTLLYLYFNVNNSVLGTL